MGYSTMPLFLRLILVTAFLLLPAGTVSGAGNSPSHERYALVAAAMETGQDVASKAAVPGVSSEWRHASPVVLVNPILPRVQLAFSSFSTGQNRAKCHFFFERATLWADSCVQALLQVNQPALAPCRLPSVNRDIPGRGPKTPRAAPDVFPGERRQAYVTHPPA